MDMNLIEELSRRIQEHTEKPSPGKPTGCRGCDNYYVPVDKRPCKKCIIESNKLYGGLKENE